MTTDRPDDVPSFEQLITPYLEKLYRLAYRFTDQTADAEDLLQDVLVKLHQRKDELSSIENLGPWLSRVLYNQFIDKQRQNARHRLRVVDTGRPTDEAADEILDKLASPEPGPAAAAENALNMKQLSQTLATLSVEHRTVLLMHDSEGYTLEEIHRVTGVPVGTLKSRLHRARARLREQLAAMEPFSGEERLSGVERK